MVSLQDSRTRLRHCPGLSFSNTEVDHIKVKKKRANTTSNKTNRRLATSSILKDPATPMLRSPKTAPLTSCYHNRVDSLHLYTKDPPELQLSPPLHALTKDNLRTHTQQTNPDEGQFTAMADSTVSSTKASVNIDSIMTLGEYGVVLKSKVPFPPALQLHIDTIIKVKRDSLESPSVKAIVSKAEALQKISEEHLVVAKLAPLLMFSSEDEHGGEVNTWRTHDCNFAQEYVTRSEGEMKVSLSRAIPDACNGYISSMMATGHNPALAHPFALDEEKKLLRDPKLRPITTGLFFPYLTAQFKTLVSGQLLVAEHQSARDGSAVCQYLHEFYKHAGLSATEVETCHWSLTCDTDSVRLFLHWRQEANDYPRFHMKEMRRAPLEAIGVDYENEGLRILRGWLRNIHEYAMVERLQHIKQALELIPYPPSSPRKSSNRSPTNLSTKSPTRTTGKGRGRPSVSSSNTSPSTVDRLAHGESSILENRPRLAPVGGEDLFQGDPVRPNTFLNTLHEGRNALQVGGGGLASVGQTPLRQRTPSTSPTRRSERTPKPKAHFGDNN